MNGSGGIGTNHADLWHRWGQHLAIAAAYGAVYEVTRHLSSPQWMLTAGLRLASLLLLPMRYWPAVALGEGLPLIETAVLCAPDLGVPWAVSESVPMAVLWMALLKPLRQCWSLHDEQGRLRMPLILGAAVGSAVITAAATLLTAFAAIAHTSASEWPDPNMAWPAYLLAYTLGAYLGALTLTPTVLALRERWLDLGGEPLGIALVWNSPLFRDVVRWALPALATLTWLAIHAHGDSLRQAARLALLCPLIALAWRHGWHGTAVGGMAASVALAIAAPGLLVDPATLQAEAMLALVVSGALLVNRKATAPQPVPVAARP